MAAQIAERLGASLQNRGVTVATGIATWDGREYVESLLHRADAAMYARKNGSLATRA